MLLGLLSDTHDRVPATAALTRILVDAGVGMILHAGDHCSPFSLMPFLDANVPVAGVFGNNDGDREGMRAQAASGMGVELYESPHSVEVGGVRILLVHDIADVAELSLNAHSIVIHGHTHLQEMKTRGDTLIVNPGEGCGWIYGAPSAALLDIDTRRVEFIKLPASEWRR
jgi:putative phosphoesterase